MKKLILSSLAVTLLIGFSLDVYAVRTNWVGKNTVQIDDTIQVTKPSSNWDTQTDHYKDPAPIKWVLHRKGANPEMYMRYRTNVKGQTAHAYAEYVKQEMQSRGITVTRIEKKVVNNRNVAVIYGTNGSDDFMVGVWRHSNIGFLLEAKAEKQFFSRYMSDFDKAIRSVVFLKESGL